MDHLHLTNLISGVQVCVYGAVVSTAESAFSRRGLIALPVSVCFVWFHLTV